MSHAQLPSLAEVQQRADAIRERGARALNVEQRLAVAAHLCGAGGRVPFALFGPPGTGKTVTLVECALQARQAQRSHVSAMSVHALLSPRCANHWGACAAGFKSFNLVSGVSACA